jgi:hypothetical protein
LAKPRQISQRFSPSRQLLVGREDRVPAVDEAGAARLHLHAVHHELQRESVALAGITAVEVLEPISRQQVPVDLPQHRRPRVADTVRDGERREGGRAVPDGVERDVRRVRRGPDAEAAASSQMR